MRKGHILHRFHLHMRKSMVYRLFTSFEVPETLLEVYSKFLPLIHFFRIVILSEKVALSGL
jgi:hypothetical protein